MSQIQVTDLTYGYEGSFDTVFENVSFGIDADWKLGLIGRNGKGKTTFLNLLRENINMRGISHRLQCLITFHIRYLKNKGKIVHPCF